MLNKFTYDKEIYFLLKDKYNNDVSSEARLVCFTVDKERLASGEPLAYVIGWVPFLGLQIHLQSAQGPDFPKPLIPRPETEWWTEKLISHLKYKFEDKPFTLLDLCSGSGAIGLAILSACENAHVTFTDIEPGFEDIIKRNIFENNLDASRATICTGDLFTSLRTPTSNDIKRFDIIATNPPYIPESRANVLDASVTLFEPSRALFSGADGLTLIKRILEEAQAHCAPDAELWMECDISNIGEAQDLAESTSAAETIIHEDQYGRPRLLVAHFE